VNERIANIVEQAKKSVPHGLTPDKWIDVYNENFAKLVIEETLKQVDERTYGRSENQWYYEDDKQWVHLHFGYGILADAQKGIFK